jgi:hypothetical protein
MDGELALRKNIGKPREAGLAALDDRPPGAKLLGKLAAAAEDSRKKS